MITNVYVDLDDTISDFLGHYYDSFGVHWHDLQLNDRWANINNYPGWWMEMPYKTDARGDVRWSSGYDFWCKISRFCKDINVELNILTATGHRYDSVSVEKRVWCWKQLRLPPSKVITVPAASAKKTYALPSAILIDDNSDNINEWNAAGGIGILHTSFKESWQNLVKIMNKYNKTFLESKLKSEYCPDMVLETVTITAPSKVITVPAASASDAKSKFQGRYYVGFVDGVLHLPSPESSIDSPPSILMSKNKKDLKDYYEDIRKIQITEI